MKWNKWDVVSFFILFCLTAVFFFRLFFSTPQLIVTPDFGRSDAWSFSFTTKYILSQNLKAGTIPLWNRLIGDGFPLLAEGQIGTFFLPNLIAFRFFDPVTAYNLTLALTVFTAMAGMYFWMRTESISRPVSVFIGAVFGFSGVVIPHLTHITLLQSFTLLPALMAITVLWARNQSAVYPLLFALVASQQFMGGFPQASFITILFTTGYYFWLIWPGVHRWKSLGVYSLSLCLTGLLCAIQLIPSREFLMNLLEPNGFSGEVATFFSFPLPNLATLIHPFILGSAHTGTYAGGPGNGNIFWENNAYIGIVPLLFALYAFLSSSSAKRQKLFFGAIFLISILLSNGKYSPLYVIYSFWPFNLFRVPSRFIWLLIPSVLLFAAYGIDSIIKRFHAHRLRTTLLCIALGAVLIDMIYIWWPYHALTPAAAELTRPSLASHVRQEDRVLPLVYEEAYSLYFMRTGWKTQASSGAFGNLLLSNGNVIWDIASHQAAVGRQVRRSAIIDSLVADQLAVGDTVATMSATGEKLLALMGINIVLSAVPLHSTTLVPIATESSSVATITLHRNPDAAPHAYLSHDFILAHTAPEAIQAVRNPSFIPGASVIVESTISARTVAYDSSVVQIMTRTDTESVIKITDNPTPQLLVTDDTYYPGWVASVDDKETPIQPVNIHGRGVMVPAGNHIVRFRYAPVSFKIGAYISGIAYLATFAGVILLFAGGLHTPNAGRPRPLHHPRNRGR